MAEEKTYVFGEGNNGWNNGWGGIPVSIPLTGFGNGYGYGNGFGYGGGLLGGGFGAGILGGILGGLIPGFFGGWGGNGFGWGNNGNGAAAASLGAQATANANTDLIIQAINGTDSDVRLLASTLNSDIDSVRLAVNTVQGAIQTVGAQLGLTGQQIINALQMGDANISRQICECCCQSQLRTVEQTNTLNNAILASGQRTVDAIADLSSALSNAGICRTKSTPRTRLSPSSATRQTTHDRRTHLLPCLRLSQRRSTTSSASSRTPSL